MRINSVRSPLVMVYTSHAAETRHKHVILEDILNKHNTAGPMICLFERESCPIRVYEGLMTITAGIVDANDHCNGATARWNAILIIESHYGICTSKALLGLQYST